MKQSAKLTSVALVKHTRTAWSLALALAGCTVVALAEAPRDTQVGAEAPGSLPASPLERLEPQAAAESAAPRPAQQALGDTTGGAPSEQPVNDSEAAARALIASLARDPAEPEPPPSVPFAVRAAPRVSMLPIPAAPPQPETRKHFAFPQGDATGEAARTIARRVATFRRFRTEVAGAAWDVDESTSFAIRTRDTCMQELERLGVRTQPVSRPLSTPVPVPVTLEAPIEGVSFVSLHLDRDVEVSCELAARLPALARILRKHGVLAVGINSSYRDSPKVSFHTFGLALDIAALRTRERTLLVATDFEVTPDARTCEATPQSEAGRALLAVVCDIARSHLFSSVITPNYNEGHRDHLHLDLRPDDPNVFVR